MFFKKRREAAAQDAAKGRQQTIDGIQRFIDGAKNIPDIAERLAEFERLQETLLLLAKNEKASIKDIADNKMHLPYWGMTTGMIGSVATAIVVLGASSTLFWAVAPAAVGGIALGKYRSAKENKARLEEAKPFFDKVEDMKAQLAAESEKLVRENVTEIATSPQFHDLQKNTRLRDIFTDAVKQRMADHGQPAQLTEPFPAVINTASFLT